MLARLTSLAATLSESAATNLNIQVARPHFEKFVQQNMY